MVEPSLPVAFNPVAVTFIVSAGIVAVVASRILSVLVGLPAREWRRWWGRRASRSARVVVPPLRPDLSMPVLRFAEATRSLLDELSHARTRVGGWNDGARPGWISRCLGLRDDDDYGPTIELFGEVSCWLQQASALTSHDGPEAPWVEHACARVRGLVVADGELESRLGSIITAVRELDSWFSARGSSPYRDRCPFGSTVVPTTIGDDEDDASSRARVLARHEALIRRVAARHADDEAAREDLCQEIRLAVWLALPKHRGDASTSTYIRRIAGYCGARWSRRQRDVEDIDEPADDGPSPELRLDDAERRAALRRALCDLPRRQREAIELLLAGLSYREIADRLGISESNASVRITRARQRLRSQLAPMFA